MPLTLEGHLHRGYSAMFWLLLIQTNFCHEWKFFWGHSCCKMVKISHHVHTSRDPLALSSNRYLATTENEAGSNNCNLQEPGKACLNMTKVPKIWLVRSGLAISSLLIYVPAYPVLLSKTTRFLLGLAGWYTPWWGKYHIFPSVGVSLEILAYRLLRICSINSS